MWRAEALYGMKQHILSTLQITSSPLVSAQSGTSAPSWPSCRHRAPALFNAGMMPRESWHWSSTIKHCRGFRCSTSWEEKRTTRSCWTKLILRLWRWNPTCRCWVRTLFFPYGFSPFCYNCRATNNEIIMCVLSCFDRGGLPALSTGMDFHQSNVLLFTFFRHDCAPNMAGR